MKDLGEIEARKIQSPVNVPVVRPSISAYTAALHMSFIALVLMASIFVIAFATFNSANAFSINRDTGISSSPEYSEFKSAGSEIQKLGLVADPAIKRILPNVEETAFNSVIFSKSVGDVRQIVSKPLAPIVHHRTVIETKNTGTSLSSTTRSILAGGLGSVFAFMIWVTARMWREFAGSTRKP